MHPAFSVIFFTTLSGAGYGLWFWSALSLWWSPGGHGALAGHGFAMLLGFVLVTAGLPADRVATVFERPHTEANYLTTEMGHVLVRKHARRLWMIALVLFAVVPALCALPVYLLPHVAAAWPMGIAAVSVMLGAAVERWLFFAEAKHVVMLYY